MELSAPLSSGNALDTRLHMEAQRLERLGVASGGDASKREQAIRKAAEEFEGMFIAQMLQHMFADVQSNPLFGDRHADKIYQSMLVEEYGKSMAKAGGIGVADHVVRQLLHTQDIAQGGQQ